MRRAALYLLLAGTALAQTFDVVSIKPHPIPAGQFFFRVAGGAELHPTGPSYTMRVATLEYLIMDAFNVKEYQISGLPQWALGTEADHYDVDAKSEKTPTAAELRQMLQAMLADRFQLKVRRDKKELPVYVLTVAPGGVKMRKLAEDEKVPTFASRPPVMEKMISPYSSLSPLIARNLDRPMIDETGLTGNYEFATLDWRQFGSELRQGESLSIFSALQEKLGLKLERRKDMVDIVVVEHAERPSGN
jgi:uncharacterized protein (TIGR03435 family)